MFVDEGNIRPCGTVHIDLCLMVWDSSSHWPSVCQHTWMVYMGSLVLGTRLIYGHYQGWHSINIYLNCSCIWTRENTKRPVTAYTCTVEREGYMTSATVANCQSWLSYLVLAHKAFCAKKSPTGWSRLQLVFRFLSHSGNWGSIHVYLATHENNYCYYIIQEVLHGQLQEKSCLCDRILLHRRVLVLLLYLG